MIKYIIIFYTQPCSMYDMYIMHNFLKSFNSIVKWTQDVEDFDKVLRIATTDNISRKLQEEFDNVGIMAKLMAVYLGNPDDSFIPECLYLQTFDT